MNAPKQESRITISSGTKRKKEAYRVAGFLGISGFLALSTAAEAAIVYTGNTKTGEGQQTYIGRNNPGSLTIDGGSSLTHTNLVVLGQNDRETSFGTVLLTGSGSTYDISSNLTIGLLGNGDFNIEAGGKLNLGTASNFTVADGPGTVGTLTVTGSDGSGNVSTFNGGRLFVVAREGSGTVNIESGTVLNAFNTGVFNGSFSVGQDSGSVGIVNVNGGTLNSDSSEKMQIGGNGSGTLNITGNGSVVNRGMELGTGSGGAGYLNMSGGSLTTKIGDADSEIIFMGRGGYAEANISGDSEISALNLFVGDSSDAVFNASGDAMITLEETFDVARNVTMNGSDPTSATASLSGNASVSAERMTFSFIEGSESDVSLSDSANLTASGDIVVGWFGESVFLAEDSSSVNANRLLIAENTLSDGLATIRDSGSVNTTGLVNIGGAGKGILRVEDGGTVNAVGMSLGTGSTGDGSLSVTSGGKVNVTGELRVGFGSGAASVEVLDSGSRLSVSGNGTVSKGTASAGAERTLHIARGGTAEFGGSGIVYADSSSAKATQRFSIGDDGTGTVSSGLVTTTGFSIGAGTANFELLVDDGIELMMGSGYTLIEYDTWNGKAFSNVADDSIYTTGDYDFLIDYDRKISPGNFAMVATVVPEPSGAVLAALGLGGLLFRRSRG